MNVLYERMLARLRELNLETSLLELNDVLITVDPSGAILRKPEGDIDVRLGNFELLYPRTGTIADLVG